MQKGIPKEEERIQCPRAAYCRQLAEETHEERRVSRKED